MLALQETYTNTVFSLDTSTFSSKPEADYSSAPDEDEHNSNIALQISETAVLFQKFLFDFVPKLFEKIETIVELEILLLFALGWKILRRRLNMTEIRFLLGIGVISFYLAIFELTCQTTSTCSGYKLSRDILHSLAFLVIIVAVNFNLHSLGILSNAKMSGSGKL
ncbi:unnamed protein product [Amoebophrya sp. A120]|nr:unnamed protein product [Amoebophrya sp. A120]|eukprot:GSA120T00020763001.1